MLSVIRYWYFLCVLLLSYVSYAHCPFQQIIDTDIEEGSKDPTA